MALIFCERCGYSVRPDERGDCPACRDHLLDPAEYRELEERRRRETEVETFGYALEPPGVGPWRAIWTRPRAAIRQAAFDGSLWPLLVLASVAGVCGSLSRAQYEAMGNAMSLGEILLFAGIGGPLSGLAGLYLFGLCLFVSGRALGGKATSWSVRAAVGWSNAIALPSLLIWGIGLLVIGHELFATLKPSLAASAPLSVLYSLSGVLQLGLGGWYLVVLVIGLVEVQRMPVWKVIISLLLAAVLMIVLLVPVVLFLFWFASRLAIF